MRATDTGEGAKTTTCINNDWDSLRRCSNQEFCKVIGESIDIPKELGSLNVICPTGVQWISNIYDWFGCWKQAKEKRRKICANHGFGSEGCESNEVGVNQHVSKSNLHNCGQLQKQSNIHLVHLMIEIAKDLSQPVSPSGVVAVAFSKLLSLPLQNITSTRWAMPDQTCSPAHISHTHSDIMIWEVWTRQIPNKREQQVQKKFQVSHSHSHHNSQPQQADLYIGCRSNLHLNGVASLLRSAAGTST